MMPTFFVSCLLGFAGLTAAAPKPTATSACPAKFTHYTAHFDDLGADVDGKTHNVQVKNSSEGVYMHLWWDQYSWQVVSPGIQTVQNDFKSATFNMTTNSGGGALVSVNTNGKSHASNTFGTYYSGEYFTINSFYVRGQNANAFNLILACYGYPNGLNGDYVESKTTFAIPAVPYGQYTKVKLSKAQSKQFTFLTDCFIGDPTDTQKVLVDDLDYCFRRTS